MPKQPRLTSEEEFAKLTATVALLAFNQQKKVAPMLREMHCLYHMPKYARYRPFLKLIRGWLVVPYSMWVRDFLGLAGYLSEQVRADNPLSPRFVLVMRLLREFPPELAQKIVALHEHDVQQGKYDRWLRSNRKFLAHEKRILNDPELRREWEMIKEEFDISLYRNPAGIIRRHIFCERNFKNNDWAFTFDDDEAEFYQIFTAFCLKYKLWCMESLETDTPKLLKITVNLLPIGFMIVLPDYMISDGGRDIRWRELTVVMKALGAARMGARRLAAREDREAEAMRVLEASNLAAEKGKTGPDRIDFIIKEVGLKPNTDGSAIRARLRLARELLKKQHEAGYEDPTVWDPRSYRAAYEEWQKTAPPRESVKLKKAKSRIADLTPEDKAALVKWIQTEG